MNTIDNISFKAIHTQKVQSALFSRLNSEKRTMQFNQYKKLHAKKLYDIELEGGKNNSLIANITDKYGNNVKIKEYEFCGKFNLNPLRFLRRISKIADTMIDRNIVYIFNLYTPKKY